MSWSLQLQNGDLALSGTKLGSVAGPAKLVQDLRCAILERMGTDDMHLEFGSLIDGGRTSQGRVVSSMLGQMNLTEIAFDIEGELRRLLANHQKRQLTRAQEDRSIYGKSTLDLDELLDSVTKIVIDQNEDKLIARVSILTGTDDQITVSVPITNEPIIGT